LRAIKQRAETAGLGADVGCHSCRVPPKPQQRQPQAAHDRDAPAGTWYQRPEDLVPAFYLAAHMATNDPRLLADRFSRTANIVSILKVRCSSSFRRLAARRRRRLGRSCRRPPTGV
jgi:hypothetical protein